MSRIGLLNEKPVHASLKQWYARPEDRLEVAVGGFVIDIVRDDFLIEIQTGNFAAIKAKLTKLVHSHHVRLIYPIIQEKWIIRPATDDGGRTGADGLLMSVACSRSSISAYSVSGSTGGGYFRTDSSHSLRATLRPRRTRVGSWPRRRRIVCAQAE